MADRNTEGMSAEERILSEAKKRFKRCEDYERQARIRWVEDTKFANGDSDNNWQWEDNLRSDRELDGAPCLTINRVRQHNLQIINDARQNKPSVTVKPVGNGATYEAAQVFEGIIRHIEYISSAQDVYDTATIHQVQGGVGYWRLLTDYADDDSFEQEIFIQRVKNPLTIYLDPDIKELDGSDARFGFVFDDMERDDFEKKYPGWKDKLASSTLGEPADAAWNSPSKVRIAEYFRRVEMEDTLLLFTDPLDGEQKTVRESELSKTDRAALKKMDESVIKRRPVTTMKVERHLIVGDTVIEEETKEWAGRYIPIVRVIGEEIEIDGQMDRWGHTRALKDPQRIYNYWSSSAVEMVALQAKTPYIGPMQAFENLETYWNDANRVNHAWLPYNAYDDKGQPIPPPQRAAPPVMAQAYISGMNIASDELRAVSGQYQAEMGMPSNEKSGVAITARQRQGDNATYHFIDNLAAAIRYTGKQLIDLIPKIYDTERIIKIIGEDGKESDITIDPNAQQAFAKQQAQTEADVNAIFNPSVGRYSVESDIGPAYATKRQEAFNAMTQIVTSDRQFLGVAGDIYFENADFPGSKDIAERYSRIVPPNIKNDGPSQQDVQMQGQIKQMQDAIVQLQKKLDDKSGEQSVKEYDAETRRIVAIGNSGPAITPDEIRPVFQQLMMEMLQGGFQTDGNVQMPQQGVSPMNGAPQAAIGQPMQGTM